MPEPAEAPLDYSHIPKITAILGKMVVLNDKLITLTAEHLALTKELTTIIEEEIKP